MSSPVRDHRRRTAPCTALALLLAVPSVAVGATATPSELVVRAGNSGVVRLTGLDSFSAPRTALPERCELRISRNGGRAFVYVEGQDSVVHRGTLRVRPPASARGGLYLLTVRCGQEPPKTVRLTVRPRAGVTPRSTPFSVVFRGATRPLTRDEARRDATRGWLTDRTALRSRYRDGQCTDLAEQRRPDVLERVTIESAITARLGGEPFFLGLAKTWGGVAQKAGYTVSSEPALGALVVWQPGVEGANAETGHVGYVESIEVASGTFTTSEMNLGAPYRTGSRTLSTIAVPGRVFILP